MIDSFRRTRGGTVGIGLCAAVVFSAMSPGAAFATAQGRQKHAPVPVQYVSVSFPDRNLGFALASQGTNWYVLSTTNNGNRWKTNRISLVPYGPLQFVDRSHGWLLGRYSGNCYKKCYSYVFASNNGGKSWKKQVQLNRQSAGEMQFVSANEGWVLDSACRGCSERVLHTTNGGKKWQTAHWEVTGVDAFGFQKGGFGWATSYQVSHKKQMTSLYLTTNGGKSWKRSLTVAAYEAWPTFSNRKLGQILVAREGQCSTNGCILKLSRTANGGKTWVSKYQVREKASGLGGFPEALWFPDTNHGWLALNAGAAPHGGGVAVTMNGGRTWKASQSLSCYRNLVPTSIAVTGPSQVWVAGGNLGKCNARQQGLAHTTDSGRHWSLMSPKR
jgi:photosystem II stability/assembly factor-like uncharacterized protein